MQALLETLLPSKLAVPPRVTELIPARPPGFPDSRELFPSATGGTFDALGPADSAIALTLDVLLEPSRAARMNMMHAVWAEQPPFGELLQAILQASFMSSRQAGAEGVIQRRTNSQVLDRLMLLANDSDADKDVQAQAYDSIEVLDRWLAGRATNEGDAAWRAHYAHARLRIDRMREDPASLEQIAPVQPPPGSPIGVTEGRGRNR
jgi:hypothetical protein